MAKRRMRMREKDLLKLITIALGLMLPIWGYLNLQLKPYGEIGALLGVIQIVIGLILLWGIWKLN